MQMAVTHSKTIVFIHGLVQNPASWQEWKQYFEAKGYTCHTPANPFHEGDPKSLWENIDPRLRDLTFGDVVANMADFIDTLPEKPILIGHSMGGMCVQKLLAADKAEAGICINSAPPKGVTHLSWSFLKSNLPIINPFKGNAVFTPSVNWFHYACCPVETREYAAAHHAKFVTPESRNIARSLAGKDGYIDLTAPHNPLLFIAGEKDHTIPAALNRKNFEAYTDAGSTTHFKEFPGRVHTICHQENWQEVADYITDWLEDYG